jgi:hypothetical protein
MGNHTEKAAKNLSPVRAGIPGRPPPDTARIIGRSVIALPF